MKKIILTICVLMLFANFAGAQIGKVFHQSQYVHLEGDAIKNIWHGFYSMRENVSPDTGSSFNPPDEVDWKPTQAARQKRITVWNGIF